MIPLILWISMLGEPGHLETGYVYPTLGEAIAAEASLCPDADFSYAEAATMVYNRATRVQSYSGPYRIVCVGN